MKILFIEDTFVQNSKIFHIHAVLPKGEKNKQTDIMITEAMKILRTNGDWNKYMRPAYHEYIDWQP